MPAVALMVPVKFAPVAPPVVAKFNSPPVLLILPLPRIDAAIVESAAEDNVLPSLIVNAPSAPPVTVEAMRLVLLPLMLEPAREMLPSAVPRLTVLLAKIIEFSTLAPVRLVFPFPIEAIDTPETLPDISAVPLLVICVV